MTRKHVRTKKGFFHRFIIIVVSLSTMFSPSLTTLAYAAPNYHSLNFSGNPIKIDNCVEYDELNRIFVDNENGSGATMGCLVDFSKFPEVRVRIHNQNGFWTKIAIDDNIDEIPITKENLWAKFGYIAPKAYSEYTLAFDAQYESYIQFFVNGARTEDGRPPAGLFTIIFIILDILGADVEGITLDQLDFIIETTANSTHLLLAADALSRSDLREFVKELHEALNDDSEIDIIQIIAAQFGLSVSRSAIKSIFTAITILQMTGLIWEASKAIATGSFAGSVKFFNKKQNLVQNIQNEFCSEYFCFAYDKEIAKSIALSKISSLANDSDMPFWLRLPAHTQVQFEGYPDQNRYWDPYISFFPINNEVATSSLGSEISTLRMILAQRPELNIRKSDGNWIEQTDLPNLPLINAGREIEFQAQYINSQSLSGIRFIAQFAQALSPVKLDELVYIFQGLTSDGEYYIEAVFPVFADVQLANIPAEPNALSDANIDTFNQTAIERLQQTDASSFTPSLDVLDSVLQSIRFNKSLIEKQPDVIITAEVLNVRQGPGTNYDPPITQLKQGAELTVSGRNDSCSWIKISASPNIEGWVATGSQYVKLNVSCETLPIISPPVSSPSLSFANSESYIRIPSGSFLMGSTNEQANRAFEQCQSDWPDCTVDKKVWFENESPQHVLDIGEYWIMRTEVTNAQYTQCVYSGVCTAPDNNRWNNPAYSQFPVTHIDFVQATTYAQWIGGRLPTEAEWEKACRGGDGQMYPWGNNRPTLDQVNYGPDPNNDVAVVDDNTLGQSPYGVLNMAGNVWEWTSSLAKPYPYVGSDGREDLSIQGKRALRGGSFSDFDWGVRCAYRAEGNDALAKSNNIGFRVVRDIPPDTIIPLPQSSSEPQIPTVPIGSTTSPTILFNSDHLSLNVGECTTIRWNVENVQAVYLNGEGVAGNDSRSVCPESTNTYKLTIQTSSESLERSLTITVNQPVGAQIDFRADRTELNAGECTTLRWDVDNVQAVYMDGTGVIGHSSGQICPATTRTYQLVVVRQDGGQEERTVTVSVQGAAVQPTPVPSISTGDMVSIPAGEFQMGCDASHDACSGIGGGSTDRPLHTVYLDAYAIDKYEVTNGRYKKCVEAGVCSLPHKLVSQSSSSYYESAEFTDYPVIYIDWFQAKAFCEWEGKRLPTEAEWEKAARGSSDTRVYPWGDAAPDCSKANFGGINGCVGSTNKVGSSPGGASPYGVMDMAGNAWEWVNDWFAADYYNESPSSNPQGPQNGGDRVVRGGAWDYYQLRGDLRTAFRYWSDPNLRYDSDIYGFRCARSE